MPKLYIEGYGCPHNISDTEKTRAYLYAHGFTPALSESDADLLIINTCAVKNPTETRMIKRIREFDALAKTTHAQVIVTGCLPKINPERLQKEFPHLTAIGPSLKELTHVLGLPEQEFSPHLIEIPSQEHISILPISTGCMRKCTFCGVWQARGRTKSYSVEELTQKFKHVLTQTRAKEIWLTSEDVGCYGYDIKTNLTSLLDSLLSIPEDFRIRLGMMNPQWTKPYKEKLAELFLRDERLYKFLHIPVQSGSNSVLKNMARGYRVEQFTELVEFFRSNVPNITIATDIIVGFSGETEEDFQQTINMITQTQCEIVNISNYGMRSGSLAEPLGDPISRKTKAGRSKKLSQLCMKISTQTKQPFISQEVTALITQKAPQGNGYMGRMNNYLPVIVKEDVRGKFVKARITEVGQNYLKADIVETLSEKHLLLLPVFSTSATDF